MGLRFARSKRAFSLLELVVAIAILSAGLVIILQALSFSGRLTGLAMDIINAAFLAQDKMQELEFKESQGLINKEPTEINAKSGKFEFKYTLNQDEELKLYKLDFGINWQRANKKEGFNLNTYLR